MSELLETIEDGRHPDLQSAGTAECAVDADHAGLALRAAAARRRPGRQGGRADWRRPRLLCRRRCQEHGRRRWRASQRSRRHSPPVLQNALDGLLSALAGWRTAAVMVARAPDQRARQEAAAVLARVPEELRPRPEQLAPEQDETRRWIADPTRLLRLCDAVVRRLVSLPADTRFRDQTATAPRRRALARNRRTRTRKTRSAPAE